jgi:hypothetical protein
MFAFAQKWPQVFSGRVESKNSSPAASADRKLVTPTRGRNEHRRLQQVIKQWAQDLGWRASIDCLVSNKEGSIDVALRKERLSIACEISVTSPADYEVGNLRKCLAAGYQHVVSVSPDETHLAAIRQVAGRRLGQREMDRIHWLTPWQLVQFVEAQDQAAARTRPSRKAAALSEPIRATGG